MRANGEYVDTEEPGCRPTAYHRMGGNDLGQSRRSEKQRVGRLRIDVDAANDAAQDALAHQSLTVAAGHAEGERLGGGERGAAEDQTGALLLWLP